MFADLVGFTSLSEKMEAEKTVGLLNQLGRKYLPKFPAMPVGKFMLKVKTIWKLGL